MVTYEVNCIYNRCSGLNNRRQDETTFREISPKDLSHYISP